MKNGHVVADWNNKKRMNIKLANGYISRIRGFLDGLENSDGSISDKEKKEFLENLFGADNACFKAFGIDLIVDTQKVKINDKEYELHVHTKENETDELYKDKVLKGKIKGD